MRRFPISSSKQFKALLGVSAAELGYALGYVAFQVLEFLLPFLKAGKASKVAKGLVQQFSNMADDVAKAAGKVINVTKSIGKQALETIIKLFREALETLRGGAKKIKQFIDELMAKFKKWLDDVAGKGKVDWLSLKIFRFGEDGRTFRNFLNLQKRADDGWYNVICHGTEKKVVINGRYHTAEAFAKLLFQNGYKSGTPVRLIACDTGRKANGFAAQLAKLLKAEVQAPTDRIAVDEVGEFIMDNKGVLKIFKP